MRRKPPSHAASPTYPGHLYLTYEDWDGTQMDVKFTQSTDGGSSWSTPATVNDNVDAAQTVPYGAVQPIVERSAIARLEAGRIDERELPFRLAQNSGDAVARRLRLFRRDADLFADE